MSCLCYIRVGEGDPEFSKTCLHNTWTPPKLLSEMNLFCYFHWPPSQSWTCWMGDWRASTTLPGWGSPLLSSGNHASSCLGFQCLFLQPWLCHYQLCLGDEGPLHQLWLDLLQGQVDHYLWQGFLSSGKGASIIPNVGRSVCQSVRGIFFQHWRNSHSRHF